VLDRPVGDASRGIEKTGLDEGAGRALLEAAHAGAAPLGDGLVGREIEVGQDLGEEKV
jgi:hypothetical protein